MNDLSLIVSSCDKYSSAWYPYFELIKRFWPEHPQKIVLVTETKNYQHQGLDINIVNSYHNETWSQRLLKALNSVDTEYILFSLEDFFLLGPVDQSRIDRCIKWMNQNQDIAECRLSSWQAVGLGDEWEPGCGFRTAGPDVPFRLDTQVAIWRKSDLISFIDPKETPWQFEGWGTERIKSSNKIFLWYQQDDMFDTSKMIFPYQIYQKLGYGIAWGHWLWNNKKWFRECNITGVDFWRLGTISEKEYQDRAIYIYSNIDFKGLKKIKKASLNLKRNAKYAIHNLLSMGIWKGIKRCLKTLKKHLR